MLAVFIFFCWPIGRTLLARVIGLSCVLHQLLRRIQHYLVFGSVLFLRRGGGALQRQGKRDMSDSFPKGFRTWKSNRLSLFTLLPFVYVVVALVVAGLPICFGLWGE